MATPTPLLKTPLAICCIAAIALGGAIVTINVVRSSEKNSGASLPPDLTVASITERAKENRTGPGMFREVMTREDLTDEQRRQAMQNMRSVFRKQMDQRMDDYFAAKTEEERTAILDAQIDEFAARRAEWEKRRKEREAAGEDDRQRMQGMFPSPTKQQRQARSENRNPDETAKRRAYMDAMRNRMSQRGISMGRGGPGGRGRRP